MAGLKIFKIAVKFIGIVLIVFGLFSLLAPFLPGLIMIAIGAALIWGKREYWEKMRGYIRTLLK